MDQQEIIINLIKSQWSRQVAQATAVLELLSGSAYNREIAPGRNSVAYIMGHMVAAQDRMIEALDIGERLYTELDGLFFVPMDRTAAYPGFSELFVYWEVVNLVIMEKISLLEPGDWLKKHLYVTQEEFAADPKNNRLNLFMGWAAHLSVHLGQLQLARPEPPMEI